MWPFIAIYQKSLMAQWAIVLHLRSRGHVFEPRSSRYSGCVVLLSQDMDKNLQPRNLIHVCHKLNYVVTR